MTRPTFSVVVPTHERPEPLRRCLEALSALDYPADRFEVVVVDDGSEQPLDDVVDRFRRGMNLRLIRQAKAGPAAARNLGARKAEGRFLAFTDDDCAPESNWLAALADGFSTHSEFILGGKTVNGLEANPFSMSSQDLISFLYDYYNRDPEDATFFASNNLAAPAAGFAAVGGFDESFPLSAGEDREFCDRWRSSGRRLVYVPEAVTRHFHDLSFRGFLRQHFNYGRGAFHFRRQTRRRDPGAKRMERWSFYWRLLRYSPGKGSNLSAVQRASLVVLMQIATVSGYFREALGAGDSR